MRKKIVAAGLIALAGVLLAATSRAAIADDAPTVSVSQVMSIVSNVIGWCLAVGLGVYAKLRKPGEEGSGKLLAAAEQRAAVAEVVAKQEREARERAEARVFELQDARVEDRDKLVGAVERQVASSASVAEKLADVAEGLREVARR